MSASDQYGIINDAFVLGRVGWTKTIDALKMLEHVRYSNENVVWGAFQAELGSVIALFEERSESQYHTAQAFGRKIFSPVAHRMGVVDSEEMSSDERLLRKAVISGATNMGDAKLIQDFRERFGKIMAGDDHAVPSDFLDITYGCVA